jgi:hypothetical protein
MSNDREDDTALIRFAKDVGRAVAVDLTKGIVLFAATGFIAAFALSIRYGGAVSTWVVALLFVAALLGGRALGRRPIRGLRRELVETNAEWSDLHAEASNFAAALERHETYSGHVAQTLDALQRIVAGDIDIAIPHYIEAGILEPARDLITDKQAVHVRLSVLLPRDDGERWSMSFAAGHSITGKAKYEQRIVDTRSRHAYETGRAQHWPDVMSDSGFRQNPRASHETRAMLSLPVRRGDQTVGVFNVVSSEPFAFDPAEETYIASLGAVISVAVGVHLKDYINQMPDAE